MPPDEWTQLAEVARDRIDAVIARLPEPLQSDARAIGYQLRERSESSISPDRLGDYADLEQEITLFLFAIRDHCTDESLDFAREVETTYLHELGHFVGLDEEHLETRGLG
jgi:Zincin-like metallopeptidase